jgi:Bacterial PH domain
VTAPARAVQAALSRWNGPPVLDPGGRAADGPVLVLRPRRIRVVAWVCAIGMVLAFAIPAAVLRRSNTGVYFRPADQVAMVLLGLLIGAGILLLARPRVRADARGVEVRNVGVPRYLPWEQVRAVAFPDGASWARLDLPYDEYLPMLAVQAVDGQRAVAGMRGLRALHRAATGPATTGPATTGPAAGPAAGGPAGTEQDRP